MAEIPNDFTDVFELPTYEEWRARVDRDLKGADFERKLVRTTPEGIPVQPLYTADDAANALSEASPGKAPFLRGTRGWRMRQRIAVSAPEAARATIDDEVARGVEAVDVFLDAAFRAGVDPDADGAPVGQGGVAVSSGYTLARVLGGLDLATTPVGIDAGANGLAALGMLFAVAERARTLLENLRATVSGDVLGTLAKDGGLPGSLDDAWDQLAASLRYCSAHAPHVRTWVTSSEAWHVGGADAALELGLTLAAQVDALRALDARGVSAEDAARGAELRLFVGRDLFMEVAKLRAARALWHRVMSLCGAPDASVHVHATCSPRTRTARDPWVNMLRGTSETFSAIIGGADSIATLPFDHALGDPDTLARRVARNTQLVLRLESSLGKVADPAGGSWYVESLTAALAERAWAVMQSIEAEGGLGAALLAGSVQRRVRDAAEAANALAKKRKLSVTGVSNYANLGETLPERSPADTEALRQAATAAVEKERAAFAESIATGSGGSVEQAAGVVDGAKAGATVGALSSATWTSDAVTCEAIPAWREAALFEALMDAVDAHAANGGDARVFVAAVGPLAKHTARAMWTVNALHAGGLPTVESGSYDDAASAVDAFKQSGAPAAVIVAHDDLYETLIGELAPALAEAGARCVLLAGRPADADAARSAGVTDFLFAGSDLYATLCRTLDALEVPR